MSEEKKKILIGSLQFSPIYKSHCCALGSLAEKNGFDVRYLFSGEYEWMLPDSLKKKTVFIGRTRDIATAVLDGINPLNYFQIRRFIEKEQVRFIYMYNFHPFFNRFVASVAKKYGITYIQHIHEPHYENRAVYGGLMQYWLSLFESFQGNLLTRTDIAILSSQISRELFKKRYPGYMGRIVIAPLIYEDLEPELPKREEPEYITLVGPPVPAKGPEIFLRIAAHAQKNRPHLRFQIISRSPIKDPVFSKYHNLRIVSRDRIPDEEMADLLRKSIAVITPYKAATQSSVVIMANMVGTPVVSSDIGGLPEFVYHKVTGFLVNLDAPGETWIEGIEFIIAHREEMSEACREYFVKNFSVPGWQNYFDEIFFS